MRRSISAALITLATIALGMTPVLASAEEGAFKARLTPNPVTATVTQIGPNLYLETVDLTGNGTDLGACTVAATYYLSLDVPWTVWGSLTITAANGDLLYLDFADTFDGTAWVGTYTITGGTGRLLNASGAGDLDVIINYTRPPTWCFDGTIVAPFAT
jgi:hypothetical protein